MDRGFLFYLPHEKKGLCNISLYVIYFIMFVFHFEIIYLLKKGAQEKNIVGLNALGIS